MPHENHENKKNHTISYENNENHEILGVPFENQENHENQMISCDNNGNHEAIITKIQKILKFHERIMKFMEII